LTPRRAADTFGGMFPVALRLKTFLLVAGLLAAAARGGDWPQILGPNRNGVADNEQIIDRLPAAGPAVVWQRRVGEGFAGVAVAGGTVVLFHRQGAVEIVEALDAESGAPRWNREFPASYMGSIAPDNGPRCVPLIAGNAVYLLGAAFGLHAVALNDGALRWSRNLAEEFGAQEGYFGAGSTPIIDDGKLLVNVGGKFGAGIVAFDPADGKELWRATDEAASYSSPTSALVEGARHTIFVTRLKALGLDPRTGAVRWQFAFGARGPTVNAATPIVADGQLFLTASYGIGAVLARVGRSAAREVWANNESLSSQYATPVYHEGHLYGTHGRADGGAVSLRCVELATGQVRWSEEGFRPAHVILADGKLVMLQDDGALMLARPAPKAYQPLGRALVLDSPARALPALAQGRLYVRDSRTLKCLDLARR